MRNVRPTDLKSAASVDEVVFHMVVRLKVGTEESARRQDAGVGLQHDADAVEAD
jgi:hypothetical protein